MKHARGSWCVLLQPNRTSIACVTRRHFHTARLRYTRMQRSLSKPPNPSRPGSTRTGCMPACRTLPFAAMARSLQATHTTAVALACAILVHCERTLFILTPAHVPRLIPYRPPPPPHRQLPTASTYRTTPSVAKLSFQSHTAATPSP